MLVRHFLSGAPAQSMCRHHGYINQVINDDIVELILLDTLIKIKAPVVNESDSALVTPAPITH